MNSKSEIVEINLDHVIPPPLLVPPTCHWLQDVSRSFKVSTWDWLTDVTAVSQAARHLESKKGRRDGPGMRDLWTYGLT